MAVTFIQSTDVGAPALSGTEGDLITLLDYCLVTNSGWTKVYSDVNRGMYQYAPGHAYYKIDDNGGNYSGEGASIRGYMTATGIDTGLENEFPTSSNIGWSGIKKSATADGTARKWVYLEDGGLVYLWIFYQGTSYQSVYTFGRFLSQRANDPYDDIIACGWNNTENTSYSYVGFPSAPQDSVTSRSADGVTESMPNKSLYNGTARGITGGYGNNGINEINGKISLTPVMFTQDFTASKQNIRGTLPGMYFPFEYLNNTYNSLDTFSNGATNYIIFKHYDSSGLTSWYCIQSNGTWW